MQLPAQPFQVFHTLYPVSEFSTYTSAVLTLFSFLEVNTILKGKILKINNFLIKYFSRILELYVSKLAWQKMSEKKNETLLLC